MAKTKGKGKSGARKIKVSKQAVDEAFKELSNWGRWGKGDQIGTLNYITPEDVVAASRLVKRGKIFALGMPLGASGPQRGLFGKRWNPIHTMLATGTDALAGRQGGLCMFIVIDVFGFGGRALALLAADIVAQVWWRRIDSLQRFDGAGCRRQP